MSESRRYPFFVHPLSAAEGGGYLCVFPDLGYCMGDGETPEEAVSDGAKALESCLEALRELGEAVPEPPPPDAFDDRRPVWIPDAVYARLSERAAAVGRRPEELAAELLSEGLGAKQGHRPRRKVVAPSNP